MSAATTGPGEALPASWAGTRPTPEQLARILTLQQAWWYGRPEGVRADLRGADLRGAVLRGADLRGADLRGADLRGADLRDADLRCVDFYGAQIRHAVLSDGTVLPDGLLWKAYVEELVPALCVAGGHTLDEVANPRVWDCHAWSNCPMHAAFGADDLSDVPVLYRAHAELFVQLYDACLLPLERVNPGVTARWAARGDAASCEVTP